MRTLAVSLLCLFGILMPAAASADTVVVGPPMNAIIPGQAAVSPQATSTDAQLQALQQQVAQLQAQIGTSGTASTSVSASCSAVVAPLHPGSSGIAVSQLQSFLARTPSLSPQGLVTGYSGSLTVAAVQAFQSKSGIAASGTPATTGYGLVGPRTAAAIQAQCGGGSGASGSTGPAAVNYAGFIQISPVSGAAPLYISVQTTVNTTKDCGAALYTLDFGDGSPQQQLNVAAGTCASEQQTYTHTYQKGGTYAIKLSAGTHSSTATVVAQ